MINVFLGYLSTIVPLMALDGLWIGYLMRDYYGRELAFLFAGTPKIGPVLAFYPLYAAAVFVLAVMPAVSFGSAWAAIWRGALLGLAAYGAYDLTNQATIANWPVGVTFADMAWGAFMTAAAAGIAYFATVRLIP